MYKREIKWITTDWLCSKGDHYISRPPLYNNQLVAFKDDYIFLIYIKKDHQASIDTPTDGEEEGSGFLY